MAHGGRRKLSRKQRRQAGIGRDRSRVKSDEVVARALREAPETDLPTGDDSISPRETVPQPAVESQPLGDLSYVPADMRRIAMLAVLTFVLLGVAAVVLGSGAEWMGF